MRVGAVLCINTYCIILCIILYYVLSYPGVEYEAEAAWKCAPYMADGVRTLGWHAQHQRLERQRLDQTVCHYTVFASELLKSSTLRLCSGPTLGLGLEISMDIECP